jgi:hypothetical protein
MDVALNQTKLQVTGSPSAAVKLFPCDHKAWSQVQVLEAASCKNAWKDCVHKDQSEWTLPRTLRKQELRAVHWAAPFRVGIEKNRGLESHNHLSLSVHKQDGHASLVQQPPHSMDQKDLDTVKVVEGTLRIH